MLCPFLAESFPSESGFPPASEHSQKWAEIPGDFVQVRLEEGSGQDDSLISKDDSLDNKDDDASAENSELEEYNRLNKMLQQRTTSTPRQNSRLSLSSRSSTSMRASTPLSGNQMNKQTTPLSPSSPADGVASKKNPPRGAKTHHKIVHDPSLETNERGTRKMQSPPPNPTCGIQRGNSQTATHEGVLS